MTGGNANRPLFMRLLLRSARRTRTNSSWLAVEAMTNSTGKMPALGQRGGQERRRADAGDERELPCEHLGLDGEDAALPLVPRLDEHAAEALRRET